MEVSQLEESLKSLLRQKASQINTYIQAKSQSKQLHIKLEELQYSLNILEKHQSIQFPTCELDTLLKQVTQENTLIQDKITAKKQLHSSILQHWQEKYQKTLEKKELAYKTSLEKKNQLLAQKQDLEQQLNDLSKQNKELRIRINSYLKPKLLSLEQEETYLVQETTKMQQKHTSELKQAQDLITQEEQEALRIRTQLCQLNK